MASRRAQAKAARDKGLKYFVAEQPCAKCGTNYFMSAGSGACVQCRKEYRSKPEVKAIECNSSKNWAANNRDKRNKANVEWRKRNPGYANASAMRQHTAKIQRIPLWADLTAIKNFYDNCPQGYHVDHIIPLRGKLVSGLHVIDNLQYLPAKENMTKNNKFEV